MEVVAAGLDEGTEVAAGLLKGGLDKTLALNARRHILYLTHSKCPFFPTMGFGIRSHLVVPGSFRWIFVVEFFWTLYVV